MHLCTCQERERKSCCGTPPSPQPACSPNLSLPLSLSPIGLGPLVDGLHVRHLPAEPGGAPPLPHRRLAAPALGRARAAQRPHGAVCEAHPACGGDPGRAVAGPRGFPVGAGRAGQGPHGVRAGPPALLPGADSCWPAERLASRPPTTTTSWLCPAACRGLYDSAGHFTTHINDWWVWVGGVGQAAAGWQWV